MHHPSKTQLLYNISFFNQEFEQKPGFLVGKPGIGESIFAVIVFLR